ncbi:MAG: single-stranded DNA-binding protein [candidate division WOR-3 bacterium]
MADAERAPRTPSAPLRLGSLNVVLLLGRVATDPDLRYTPKGSAVLSFRIAVDRAWKDKTTDEWKREASFFNVNVWGQAAERLSEIMRKGSAVLVEGQLRSRTYEPQQGDKRTVVEIWSTRTQVLDKIGPSADMGTPTGPVEEEPDIPKDQLDDIPF